MDNTQTQRLLGISHALRTSLLTVISQVDNLCALLEASAGTHAIPPPADIDLAGHPLRIDRAMYVVRWKQRRCSLGNTLGFRLLDRLARRPNQYIQTASLVEDLWSGSGLYSTVRSTVCRLKARLRADGMGDLAGMIDGHVADHYGLIALVP